MEYPLWATPQRRANLVELFTLSGGFCVFGHGMNCPDLLEHCYELRSEELIEDWKGEDREERARLWRLEQHRLHAAPHQHLPKVKTREWDSIVQENHLANRPLYSLVGVGMCPLTFKRVAKVEIPGLRLTIWVDISGIALSKKELRKIARHAKGGGAPPEIANCIEAQVKRYL